jgi:hypothetical protein
MSSDNVESVSPLLRKEVLPALRAFGVAHVEVAYEAVGGHIALRGTQFRDALGNRTLRFTLPAILLVRMEECLCLFAHESRLVEGEGVLAIDLLRNELALRHSSRRDGDVSVHKVLPL